jgi:hypothetical protein
MDLIDIGIYFAYILFFIAAGAMFVLPVVNALRSPKDLVKSGMALGVMAVLFIIAFAISGSELTPKWISLGLKTEFGSRMIGAGLTTFYFVFAIAIIAMIFSEVSKALK